MILENLMTLHIGPKGPLSPYLELSRVLSRGKILLPLYFFNQWGDKTLYEHFHTFFYNN